MPATESMVNLESGSQGPGRVKNSGGVCTKKRLAILAIFGIVVFAVVVGLAVGLSNSAKGDNSEAPLKDRVERAKGVLEKYPLVDG